jgi:thiamine-monophosphate kinase
MAAGEFELIERFFGAGGAARPDVLLGIGDDAALLDVGAEQALALCVDTLVEGVHFPPDAPPESVGHKALAVNLSDLAAMGARPTWALLSLTLPQVDESWLLSFSRGLKALAREHGVALVGGDTTRGPLAVSIQLAGWVPPEQALRRDRARAGDAIYVSGRLGDAAAGLAIWQDKHGARHGAEEAQLIERLHRPQPRVALGQALLGRAHAAIDISDGLLADLGHVLTRSAVGARIEIERLPLSPALRRLHGDEQARRVALSGGDDYELCFTMPTGAQTGLEGLGVPVTRIGLIEPAPGLRLCRSDGTPFDAGDAAGYEHFR